MALGANESFRAFSEVAHSIFCDRLPEFGEGQRFFVVENAMTTDFEFRWKWRQLTTFTTADCMLFWDCKVDQLILIVYELVRFIKYCFDTYEWRRRCYESQFEIKPLPEFTDYRQIPHWLPSPKVKIMRKKRNVI